MHQTIDTIIQGIAQDLDRIEQRLQRSLHRCHIAHTRSDDTSRHLAQTNLRLNTSEHLLHDLNAHIERIQHILSADSSQNS